MGEQELNRNFTYDERKDYIKELVFFTIFAISLSFSLPYLMAMSEKEVMQEFGHQELTGGARGRLAQGVEMFIVNNFGKLGLLGTFIIGIIGTVIHVAKTAFEYRRFIIKTKLFKQGLVQDMYDTERITVMQFIKNIFKKKTTHYHSGKRIQKEQKKNK